MMEISVSLIVGLLFVIWLNLLEVNTTIKEILKQLRWIEKENDDVRK